MCVLLQMAFESSWMRRWAPRAFGPLRVMREVVLTELVAQVRFEVGEFSLRTHAAMQHAACSYDMTLQDQQRGHRRTDDAQRTTA